MPVAFNPPPLPTHDALAPTHKPSNRDGGDDAFASLLAIAGLAKATDTKIEIRDADPADSAAAAATVLGLLPPVVSRNDPAVPAATRGDAPAASLLAPAPGLLAPAASLPLATVGLPVAPASTVVPDEVTTFAQVGVRPMMADALRSVRTPPESTPPRQRVDIDTLSAPQSAPSTPSSEPAAIPPDRSARDSAVDAAIRSMTPAPTQPLTTDVASALAPASERVTKAAPAATKEAPKRATADSEVQAIETPATNTTTLPAAVTPSPHAAALTVSSLTAPARSNEPTPSNEITARVGTATWTDEAAQKIAHVVIGQNDRAELRVHPAELGPIEIRVNLKADQATVNIIATHTETRHALEQALPQLRDLLAQGGITLTQASVQDGASQRQDAQPERARPSITSANPPSEAVLQSPPAALAPSPVQRLVDVFA